MIHLKEILYLFNSDFMINKAIDTSVIIMKILDYEVLFLD